MISLVSAVPPFETEFSGDTNLVIEANVMDTYKINEGACVHIFVFNKTSGTIETSDTTSCMAELTDHNGTVIAEESAVPHETHFVICRPANAVTSVETYGLSIICNNTAGLYGIKTHFFEATQGGRATADGIIIVFLSLFSLAVMFFLLWSLYIILMALTSVTTTYETVFIGLAGYLSNLALYYYLFNFLNLPLMQDLSLIAMSVFGITHLMVPLVGLIFSWIKNGGTQ